ncbi:arylamine N-acetyltransferase family protein [Neobacillus sp. D3-1R]|uniref:arylamine N-acetyltransferase family protein n=1 Tax=Neobacillus sp. D3-1R TaxID=3445778 RepID=UPI003FA06A82
MEDLNNLFRKRIDFPENEMITFEQLNSILEKTALAIPFENLCVIRKKTADITQQNLIQKILQKKEGGLCYELNTILYYFLKENGFHVNLARAIVFEQASQDFAEVGRTHVIILLQHQHETYVVDTGFGGNLPLRPVPLRGDTISSFNGEFRIRRKESEHGDHILQMKLKHKDENWRTGYAFHSLQLVTDISEMNEVQQLIMESPKSPFNKTPLITKLTKNGSQTLAGTSYTQWTNGKVTKEDIDEELFYDLAKKHFQLEESTKSK